MRGGGKREREEQHGRTHAGREFAFHPARIKGRVVDRHRAGDAVPGDARSLFLKERDQLLDIRYVGHVEESDGFVGQQRGAQDGQHGVLVARRRDGAGQRFAAVDDEIGHGRR